MSKRTTRAGRPKRIDKSVAIREPGSGADLRQGTEYLHRMTSSVRSEFARATTLAAMLAGIEPLTRDERLLIVRQALILIAVSGLRSGDNAAERDLLMQEFAQICFDHPNAHNSYRRGLVLASAGTGAIDGDPAAPLDAGGIAKYASTRLRRRLSQR